MEDPEERVIVEPGEMYTAGYIFEQTNHFRQPLTEEESGLIQFTTVGEEVSCFLPQLHQIPFDDNNDREFTLGLGPMIGSGLDDITDGITTNLEGILEDISYMVPVAASNVRISAPTSHPGSPGSRSTTRIIRPSQMQPLSSRNTVSVPHIPGLATTAYTVGYPSGHPHRPTRMQAPSAPDGIPSSPDTIPSNNVHSPAHPRPARSHFVTRGPICGYRPTPPPYSGFPTVENADEDDGWHAPIAPMHAPFTPEGTPHPVEVPFSKEAAPPPESPPRNESPEPASPPTTAPKLRRSTRKRAAPDRYIDQAGR